MYYVEWKSFIKASYVNNMHSGEKFFGAATIERLRVVKLRQSKNTCNYKTF